MRKRTIVVITIILLLLVILLLILFNSYLNSEEDENVVQNVVTNTNNSNIETNVNSSQDDVNTDNEVTNSLANANQQNSSNNRNNIDNTKNNEGGEEEMKLNIKIGERNFTATLEDNATTRELLNKLPLTINMSELHGNEKYYYFDESMPTNSIRVGNINTGDLMLYGSDCLVLFYDSFSTPYSYTRLGHIDNPEGLAEAVGSGNVTVTFEN